MPTTKKRLYGPAQVATGPATVYTVPASTKAVIRNMLVSNPSASAVLLTVSVGADAAGTRIFSSYSIPAASAGIADSVRVIWLGLVMTAAEILQLSAGTNNILVVTFNGEEYSV